MFVFVLVFVIVWFLSGDKLFAVLSFEKSITNPHILLVEGYLHDNELKEAADIFRNGSYQYIITTGLNTSEYYIMGRNGDLVIDVKRLNLMPGKHTFSYKAYNTQSNEVSGEVETWVNNTKIGQSTISRVPKGYFFSFDADSCVDLISIRLLNIAIYKNQDIDVYISTVTVDSFRFSVNDTMNYFKSKHDPGGKSFLASNDAIRTKKMLIQYNIPSNKIIPVPTNFDVRSRTAETAMNTLRILDTIFNTDTLRINIFSRKPHTLRTYLAYNKFVKNNLQIGIMPSTCYISLKGKRKLKNLREIVGILYLKISYLSV